MDFRPVFFVIGIFLLILSISMLLPFMVDVIYGNDNWKHFFISIIVTAFFGGLFILSNIGHQMTFSVREAFLMTSLSWIILSAFAAVPFHLTNVHLSITDSVFEAVSGITTTGASVMSNLDKTPEGILLWRAVLQWLGGIGIIVMAFSVMPFLKVGGMQLFRTESSQQEKVMPRMASLSSSIAGIYLALTLACIVCYRLSGMGLFDSVAHAMTTISTGGFSTHDLSIGAYDNPVTEMVSVVFMILGSLPFVLFLRALQNDPGVFYRDTQIRWFFSILLSAVCIISLYLINVKGYDTFTAFRYGLFNICSIMTGTGYSSTDYGAWGPFAIHLFFFIMVIGGCAGSTTCGIKIFRFQVLYEVAYTQIKKLLHPHGVFIMHYNHRPMPEGVSTSVMSFFFMYALCFSILAMLLSLTGLDMITSMSGAATSISNVGPGLGSEIGPSTTFVSLPDSAKWILCVGMLLGRLELFTVLVLLSPHFWKR